MTDSNNPLLDIHRQAEAELQPYGDIEVVSTFGEPQAEYAAIRKGTALFDWPQRGIIELQGKDRLSFLNNLLTNQTWDKCAKRGLEPGRGAYAFFLNNKGRIVTDVNVLELGERTYLELERRLIETMRQALEKYHFAEQVTITSRAGALHQLALHGPGARELLNRVVTPAIPEDLPALGSMSARIYDTQVILWRDDPAGAPGYHLIVSADDARRVWMNLIAGFAAPGQAGKRDLRPAGWAAFNATRIEAGRPFFGIDFDESVLPAETGQLDRAVSFTKGCYLGQEIVARMHARGQLARQLVGLRMAGEELPIAGVKIYDEQDNEVGGVTSSTISPVLSNAAIALGYVKKGLTAPGTTVCLPAEGALRQATVTALPFVGG